MPVLTSLSQFEQYDLETEMCDTTGIGRATAGKILAQVFVPAFEARVAAETNRRFLAAAAAVERMDRITATPLDAVEPADETWYRAPAQAALRRALGLKNTARGEALAHWLRAFVLRSDS